MAAPTAGGFTRTTQERIALGMLRDVFEELVQVDKKYVNQYAALLTMPDTGLVRVLHRGRFLGLDEPREGGAFYSFATRSHSYNDEPDIKLEQGSLDSGFYGASHGIVVDIGACDLAVLDTTLAVRPPSMPESSDPVWKHLTDDARTAAGNFDPAYRDRTRAIVVDRGAKAIAGRTYLVRAILIDEHDHLVAFTVLDQDADGVTLVWRILKAWPAPKR
jgi:regulator of extracellular matrix RemA (YlzA/DUF370 family)